MEEGSPSEEAGLQVGDQILDVNGHSFVSIFHQEAVHILRAYPTLIMTIKVRHINMASILAVCALVLRQGKYGDLVHHAACMLLHLHAWLLYSGKDLFTILCAFDFQNIFEYRSVFLQSLGRLPTLAPVDDNVEGESACSTLLNFNIL